MHESDIPQMKGNSMYFYHLKKESSLKLNSFGSTASCVNAIFNEKIFLQNCEKFKKWFSIVLLETQLISNLH